jgi:hypothetical protein
MAGVCKPPSCHPATKKQTLIIAIVFAVVLFLIFLMVLWYYRCFCCFSRKGDKRGFWERLDDGVSGWAHGGVRPRREGIDEPDEVEDFKQGRIQGSGGNVPIISF